MVALGGEVRTTGPWLNKRRALRDSAMTIIILFTWRQGVLNMPVNMYSIQIVRMSVLNAI